MKTYLGTMNYRTVDEAYEAIKEAYRVGYAGVDSAFIYGNGDIIGDALFKLREEGKDVKIQTKIWTSDFENVNEVFEKMLEDLKVNKVETLLLHRPSLNFENDIKAWKDLIALKKAGKVERIGLSNYDKDMIQILIAETGVTPEVNQIEMSLSNFREDRLVYGKQLGMELQAWSPMGKDPKALMNSPQVEEIAKSRDLQPGQVMLGFLTTQGLVPIAGTSKVERLKENITTPTLTKEEIESLRDLNTYDNKFEETYPH